MKLAVIDRFHSAVALQRCRRNGLEKSGFVED